MTTFDLPPHPWERLPDPPADPTQHLAFWQAVGRSFPIRHSTTEAVTDEARLHKDWPLTFAAEALEPRVVADLLDDPAVRAALQAMVPPDPDDGALGPSPGEDPQAWDERERDEPAPTPLDRVLSTSVSTFANLVTPGAENASDDQVQEAIVAMLLAAGAVPNPIVWLAIGKTSNPALVDRLMASGHPPLRLGDPAADTRPYGMASTALHLAAENTRRPSSDVLERLLAHGWAVDAVDSAQRTALYSLLRHARLTPPEDSPERLAQDLQLLLAHGAALEWPTHGDHAMITAARSNSAAGVDALMAAGAGHLLDRPASDHLPPLDHALNAYAPLSAERLLAHGASIRPGSLAQAHAARETVHQNGAYPAGVKEQLLAQWDRVLQSLIEREAALLRALVPDPDTPSGSTGPTGPNGPLGQDRLPRPRL